MNTMIQSEMDTLWPQTDGKDVVQLHVDGREGQEP